VEAFILMTGLADEIDAAIAEAVKGLRAYGYSWAEIGSRLGITCQAAQQRWGYNVASPAVPHTTATGGKSRSPHTFHFGREQARASSPIRAGQRHRSSKLGISIRLAAIAVGCPCSAWTCGFRCALAGQQGAPRRNTSYRSGGDMAQTKASTSVKNKALYKRLRNLGVSVKESTRVANANKSRPPGKKDSQRGGAATSYANWKVPQLRRRAKKVGIKGRSTMNKKQLIKALRTS
jgi:hypothetical protein